MKAFSIKGKNNNPTIHFDPSKGTLEISGMSVPENSYEFYQPLINCICEYIEKPQKNTEINIKLTYFNTSTSKILLNILKKMEEIHKKGLELIVNWHYSVEDIDMLEAGQDYQTLINLPINMVEY